MPHFSWYTLGEMDRKMKGIVGALGVIALFTAWQFLHALQVPASNSSNTLAAAYAALSTDDTDHDGLTDREESTWGTDFQNPDTDGDGYLDGEEVVSGHDPTKAGPDDTIDGFGAGNLSKRLDAMLVSGLAEGSLKPDSPNFNDSANAIADDLATRLKTSIVIPKPIVHTVTDSADSKATYIRTVFPVIENLPVTLTPESENPFVYTVRQQQAMSSAITTLEGVDTPQSYAPFHAEFVYTLQSVDQYYRLLAVAEAQQDNVTKLGVLNALTDILYGTLPNLVEQFFGMVNEFS